MSNSLFDLCYVSVHSFVPVAPLPKYNNYTYVQDDKCSDVVGVNPAAVSGLVKWI